MSTLKKILKTLAIPAAVGVEFYSLIPKEKLSPATNG